MTKEELINKLKELHDMSDIETAHSMADDLLIAFINDTEIEEAYNKVEKWYA